MARPFPRRGELWLVDLEPVRGHEQGRTRPALVVSDDIFNGGPAGVVIVVPVTTKRTYRIPTHLPLDPPDGGLTRPSHLLCDQVRTISTERLLSRIGALPARTVQHAVSIIADLIGVT